MISSGFFFSFFLFLNKKLYLYLINKNKNVYKRKKDEKFFKKEKKVYSYAPLWLLVTQDKIVAVSICTSKLVTPKTKLCFGFSFADPTQHSSWHLDVLDSLRLGWRDGGKELLEPQVQMVVFLMGEGDGGGYFFSAFVFDDHMWWFCW